MSNAFLQIQGKKFNYDGKEIILRGFGIGTWMNIEHFMIGLPGTEKKIRQTFADVYGKERSEEFFQSLLGAMITEDDFQFLKELGVNCIRLPFNYRHFEDDQKPGVYKSEGFRHLDRVLALCGKYRIFAILDLHAVPGAQNPDWHADSEFGVPVFWQDGSFRERVIGLWRFVADHFKDNPWVAGYDIINEPYLVADENVFRDFFKCVTGAVREVDRRHILFLEGEDWAKNFTLFDKPEDPQTAYSFHLYPSHVMKDKKVESWRKKNLEEVLIPIIRAGEKFGRPLWCGETGAGFSRETMPLALTMLHDMLDLLEGNNVSWTIWTYKDAQTMGLCYPRSDTQWMKFVKEFKTDRNLFKKDHVIAEETISNLEKAHTGKIGDALRHRVQFRLRGIFHHIFAEQFLKPKLKTIPWEEMQEYPKSFLWENCGYWEEIAELVKSVINNQ
ncbi:MAG: glycoside hydrolase family 5 protein [Bacillota bacterium]